MSREGEPLHGIPPWQKRHRAVDYLLTGHRVTFTAWQLLPVTNMDGYQKEKLTVHRPRL